MKRPLTTPAQATLAGVVLATLLAACGTTGSDGAGGGTTAPGNGNSAASSSSRGCEDDDTPTSIEPVSLTDSFGRSVELDQPAERVAVLEWQQVEDVLTLCLTPVAVADAAGYSTWVTAEALPDGVEDVGGRGEPNLDAIFATDPDLVIVEAYAPDDEIISQLEGYGVPVLATSGADAADPIQHMVDLFGLIAEATGRTARADAVIAEFEASLAEAEAAIADVELDTTDFVYLDGYIEGGNVALRPFGQGSLVGELGERLGLTNAWTGEVDEAYGLGQTDIEGISEVGYATFFYTGTDDPESEDVIAALQDNPIWSSLTAVTEDRTHAFPTGVWTFGGPRSSQQVLDAYVDVLTS